MSVIDLNAERERREQAEPPHPILEALDALAVALTNHGHLWTDRERQLYETAVAYVSGARTGSDLPA
jgi:hypothetical protein